MRKVRTRCDGRRRQHEFLVENSDAQWLDSSTDKEDTFLLELLPKRRVMATLTSGWAGSLTGASWQCCPL